MNSSGGDGAEVIYALRNNSALSDLILDQLQNRGQNVRKAYQRRLPSDTSKDYYFMHRNTGKTEPVIVEYGFLDSTGDDVNQIKNDWQNLAEGVVQALLTYIGKNSEGYYIVKSGDTLYSIARDNNTTVSEIKSLNNLTSDVLSIGQRLRLPGNDTISSPTTGTTTSSDVYTVKSGDTLYSIAKKYNISVNELMNYNNLNNTTLSLGQQLRIPSSTSQTQNNSSYITYTVKSGDNLYNIARTYDTTVNDIMSYNNLTTNLLSIGQVLKIPTNSTNTYTVKSGDSLYSIAKNYNTTVDELKRKNNLTSNLLSIGQVLKV